MPASNPKLAQLFGQVHALSHDEYAELRAEIKRIDATLLDQKRRSFTPGDHITWTTKKKGGGTVIARVDKVNEKNLRVTVVRFNDGPIPFGFGTAWNVSPQLAVSCPAPAPLSLATVPGVERQPVTADAGKLKLG